MTEFSDYELQLLQAVQRNDVPKFKLMVNEYSKKCSITWKNIYHKKSGDTILHIASRSGFLDILRYLKDDADFEQSNFDGKRPIHEAAQYGQLKCLQFLLEIGVKIDCLKRADWTPLMLACTKDNLKIIQCLIEAGADPKLRNKDGWNSFHIACREGHLDIVTYLLKLEPLLCDNISNNGRTPLHTAALHGKLHVVNLLLDKGSFNIDVQDSCGSTPFMDASRSGHTEIMELLIKYQADFNKKDILGRNSLHLAAQAGSLDAVNYLVNNCKVDSNSLSVNHQTALHFAAKEGQEDAVSLLLQLGTDCSVIDNKGRTAYHIAESVGHKKCYELLKKNN
ncbi:ankyrin repeat domain-containing protein 16-like [Centruroides sculpturatus]|uniref:ankyrin repeat domain-containing protein 16-like n=1 Tax=Centruroides sculpturatus TaxID=218467 RepID=UPI000C6E36BC|nr:ankyrin repeat domain-containing protein 16-like [Centruroides sculpturatus]